MIRVLVIEDVPLFRTGLRRTLEQTDDCGIIGESTDMVAILALAAAQHPDVVLLHEQLSTASALDIAMRLLQEVGPCGVFVWATSGTEEQVFAFLRAGAAAYERRSLPLADLVDKVRRVGRGEYLISSESVWFSPQAVPARLSPLSPTRSGQDVESLPTSCPLLPRQLQVLNCLARGMSNKEIDQALHGSAPTAKSRITSILKTLGVADRTVAVLMALRQGWIPLEGLDRDPSANVDQAPDERTQPFRRKAPYRNGRTVRRSAEKMQTFQSALEGCSNEDVERLARLWGVADALPGHERRLSLLERTMRSPVCARFVWEQLSADERAVLYQVLQTRGTASGITRAGLIKRTGLDAASTDAALARLTSSLLVVEESVPAAFPEQGSLPEESGQPAKAKVPTFFAVEKSAASLAETGRELFAGGDPTLRSLAEILRPLPWEQLHSMAQAHRFSLEGGQDEAEALSQALAEALCRPLVILETLRGIDLPLYQLCFWLYDQGGRMTMQAVRAYTGSDGNALVQVLDALSQRALAFDSLTPSGERLLFMPQEVHASLRRDLDACASALRAHQTPLPRAPGPTHASGPLLLYDLAILLGASLQNDLELTKDGHLLKRDADGIRTHQHGLVRPDVRGFDQYLFLLCQFALQQRLLQVVPASSHNARPSLRAGIHLAGFAALPLIDQVKRLFGWWTQTEQQFDVCWGKLVQKDPFTWEPARARALLLSYLKTYRPGKWYSISALLETLWEYEPYALRTAHYGPGLLGSRMPYSQRDLWDRCEAKIFHGILCSTLYELGIVALAGQEGTPDQPEAFLVTELGAAVLATPQCASLPARQDQPASSPLFVLPTFEVYLLQTDLRTVFCFLPFAEVEQIDERASRFRLTRRSVQRALEGGMSGEEIVALLQQHMRKGNALPQSVVYSIRQWASWSARGVPGK